jgi:hypothetical protein
MGMSEPSSQDGPSGQLVLSGVIAWLFVGWCGLSTDKFHPPDERLIELVAWGFGCAIAVGVALASVYRGPRAARSSGALALVISLLSVGYVMMRTAERLLR